MFPFIATVALAFQKQIKGKRYIFEMPFMIWKIYQNSISFFARFTSADTSLLLPNSLFLAHRVNMQQQDWVHNALGYR